MLSRLTRIQQKPYANRHTKTKPATMATSGVSAFLSQHDLQAKIEDALNRCVKSKPDEPLSFLVRPFETTNASRR